MKENTFRNTIQHLQNLPLATSASMYDAENQEALEPISEEQYQAVADLFQKNGAGLYRITTGWKSGKVSSRSIFCAEDYDLMILYLTAECEHLPMKEGMDMFRTETGLAVVSYYGVASGYSIVEPIRNAD